ncbi:hypothetical protein [Sphingobium aromaticivastans]|uniref:hypothetical protein n=1 Tax=Sphingobium aromaticivastans TaxID=1778665 RepID=UPI00301B4DA0
MKRVITTNDEQGRSRILIEEAVSPHSLVWETRPGYPLGLEPQPGVDDLDFPRGQIQARYVELPPDAMLEDYLRQGCRVTMNAASTAPARSISCCCWKGA